MHTKRTKTFHHHTLLAPAHTTHCFVSSKTTNFACTAMASSTHCEPTTAELLRRHAHARRSFWAAWVYEASLKTDHQADPKELTRAVHLLHMMSINFQIIKSDMRERGMEIPSDACSVISLFPKEDEEDEEEHDELDNDGPHEPVDREVFDELEKRWQALDRAYWVAWIQQHQRVLMNDDKASFDSETTSSYMDMMTIGPTLQAVETELMLMGWHRPRPCMAQDVFGGDA